MVIHYSNNESNKNFTCDKTCTWTQSCKLWFLTQSLEMQKVSDLNSELVPNIAKPFQDNRQQSKNTCSTVINLFTHYWCSVVFSFVCDTFFFKFNNKSSSQYWIILLCESALNHTGCLNASFTHQGVNTRAHTHTQKACSNLLLLFSMTGYCSSFWKVKHKQSPHTSLWQEYKVQLCQWISQLFCS